MKPLGNEKQNALSRKWTKAMRKAGKAKGRQDNKKKETLTPHNMGIDTGNGGSPV